MSAEQYIEQDPQGLPGGNELPTYDDLANQNGPNSRFGRWRGWIEKRAAERYADITPEERERRRIRGWDLHPANLSSDSQPQHEYEQSSNVNSNLSNIPTYNLPPRGSSLPLHIQTDYLSIKDSPPHTEDNASTITPRPVPFVCQPVASTHLKISHFGSRFLPHTTSQIRCVLPLLTNRMLLVGHDDGLSVLDMFPQEWTEHGEVITKGPDEAQCRPIWKGETVFQLSILETEDIGNGTPQGVVLAIVGPSHHSSSGKEQESTRVARMYSLSSLISLARWTVANKGCKLLDLHRMGNWQAPSTPSKKHKAQASLARGIKSLIDTPQSHHGQVDPAGAAQTQGFLSPTLSTAPGLPGPGPSPNRGSPTSRRNSSESAWNVVDDLPLRWATDYVPLAVPGSRLVGATVITFATWGDDTRKGRMGGQLLAIATKTNILLYETPKGERAYRFVKEFYTPLQPRQLTFIQQSLADGRGPTENSSSGRFHSHKRSDSGSAARSPPAPSSVPLSYGSHLSLFVVFDKKVGLIRLADSAVGEVELGDDGGPQSSSGVFPRDTFASTISASSLRQRARLSFDIRESVSKWILPVRCDLPVPGNPGFMQPVHILTKGKRTHVVPCPLPTRLSSTAPLHAVFWKSNPKHVSARVIFSHGDPIDEPPLLQLVAFGEGGLEVQEVGVSFMANNGKGRAFPDEQLRGEEDVGDAGFLTTGGNWDRIEQIYGSRTMPSASSMLSIDSMDSTDLLSRLKRDEGIYGWCRKGLEDWRVFWVGGDQEPIEDFASEELYSGDYA